MNNASSDNLYTILGVSEDANTNEIKKAYHRLALTVHPDKISNSTPKCDEFATLTPNYPFSRINHAWNVLKDAEKRRNYDSQIGSNQTRFFAAREVDLDDLTYDSELKGFVFLCQCGDKVIVQENELESEKDMFECFTCSLCIKVLYCVNDEDIE